MSVDDFAAGGGAVRWHFNLREHFPAFQLLTTRLAGRQAGERSDTNSQTQVRPVKTPRRMNENTEKPVCGAPRAAWCGSIQGGW
jgi:hypothetical protein